MSGVPVFCEACGELVEGAECEAIGVDPDAPRCRFCCRCADCGSAAYSSLHDPSTRNDAP